MSHLQAVFKHRISDVHIIQSHLCELALQEEDASETILHHEVDRLIDFLHIDAFRGNAEVREDDTVAAEVPIVGLVAEVATIGPEGLAVATGHRHLQSLVFPVPDEFTHERRIVLVEVVHLPLVAHRVAHSVGVLALHVRAWLLAGTVLCEPFLTDLADVLRVGIHSTCHVAPLAVALIMGEARIVEFLDGLHDVLEVLASTTFVARRPKADATMVAQREDLAL